MVLKIIQKNWSPVVEQDIPSLKLTASLPLKMDGWKTFPFPFWGPAYLPYFQGRTVSFREGIFPFLGGIGKAIQFCWDQQSKVWWITLQGTNISHLGKRKIIFKHVLDGDYSSPECSKQSLVNCWTVFHVALNDGIALKYAPGILAHRNWEWFLGT